jgi:hypothetical protein
MAQGLGHEMNCYEGIVYETSFAAMAKFLVGLVTLGFLPYTHHRDEQACRWPTHTTPRA